jgi:hypothetical protein
LQHLRWQGCLDFGIEETGNNGGPDQQNYEGRERGPKSEIAAIIARAGVKRSFLAMRQDPGTGKSDEKCNDRQP